MRFKATLVDINSVRSLTKTVGTIARLSKSCILKLTDSKLIFILSDTQLHGGTTLWCDLPQAKLCSGYDFVGHGDKNEVFLDVPMDMLNHGLKSAQQAKILRLKLMQKKTPCLTLDITLASLSSNSRAIVHDIPLRIVPSRQWSEYAEPNIPDFDVSIYMPPLKTLKNVVEKLKNLSPHLSISANNDGEMVLKVKSDLVTVSVSFKDLLQATWKEAGPSQSQRQSTESSSQLPNKQAFFTVKIDVKKLHQFLSSLQLSSEKIICNLIENEAVQMFFLHDDMSLQFTIPAQNAVG